MNPPPQPNFAIARKNCLIGLCACAGVLLLIPLGLLLFILFFYVEEDWRGAHAWARARADIEAQGETLDPAKFIPAPVPKAENFGALPFFKVVTGPGGITGRGTQHFAISDSLSAVADSIATSPGSSTEKALPYLGNWLKGEPPDSENFSQKFTAYLKRVQPDESVPADATPFDIFERICPELADLRADAQSHPVCVFPEDIDYATPDRQTFGADTSLIQLVKVLMYDARLAMLAGHPDIALADFRVGWRVASGVQKRPFYVANLVASGIIAIQLSVIEQGVATHTWDNAQLTELESDMTKLDYLAQSRRQLEGELACYSLPMTDYYATHRAKWAKDINLMRNIFSENDTWQEYAFELTYRTIPDGWFALSKANEAEKKMHRVRAINLISHRVSTAPDLADSSDPALVFLTFILPEINLTKGIVIKIAYFQAQIDMARIACRLERYRLAHGGFPATLDALVPIYGAELPHDVMTGKPYIYRLDKDGNYTLYSAGWNQQDDGGNIASTGASAGSSYPTSDSLDWVWLNHAIKKK